MSEKIIYKRQFSEEFYSIQVHVDSDNVDTKAIEKNLNKILGWDKYDREERYEWIIYSFTKNDFKKIKKLFNFKDTDNIILEDM